MTDQDFKTSFGMCALTVALKAKSGQLNHRAVIAFATRALDFIHDDAEARGATIDFLTRCETDPILAGRNLHDFLTDWVGRDQIQCVESTFQNLTAEAEIDRVPFDWQKRADFQ